MTCRCGHPADTHEHYRPGSNCTACACPRYRRALLRAAGDAWFATRATLALLYDIRRSRR